MEPEDKIIPNPNEGPSQIPKDLPQKDFAAEGSAPEPSLAKPRKSINLINNYGPTTFGYGTIKEAKVAGSPFTPKKIAIGFLIFSLSLIFFSFIVSKTLPKKEGTDVSSATKPQAVTATRPGADNVNTPRTYTNLEDRFSITHPQYVTEGRSFDDPFPVALELRYNEPVVEIKIGEEKPGWYVRISKRIAAKTGVDLKEFALGNRLLSAESVSVSSLAGVPAITWHSAVYPQTFYLLDTGDGLFFIKTYINSQNESRHRESIDSILSTLKFLAKQEAPDPDLGLAWVRRNFGDSWDIEVPQSWQVQDVGAGNGLVTVTGSYLGSNYRVTFSYPDFTDQQNTGVPDSLGSWVLQDLNKLDSDQRSVVKTNDLKVGGTFSQEVLDYPQPGSAELTDRLYIWKRNGRNPSSVIINQTSGELDGQKMQTLFERFIKGIN